MSNLEAFNRSHSRISSAVMMSAMSPLWAYYSAVAMGGVAFWYATRWTRPVNLEAVFAGATPLTPAEVQPPLEVIEAVADVAADLPEVAQLPEPELPTVTAESVIEMLPEPEPQPLQQGAAEPVAETVAELAPVPESVPRLKLRARKAATVVPDLEA
ncbi:hypothetical protein [Phenylobacterium sp.]|jgi:hypothetical protein|uniref:hypothetical protein n=1 Tax=Phenylobacterium sp. TaxID=1871053 RepID=UPI0037C75CB0